MSILIDDREDTDLIARLLQLNVPVSVVRLEFGDVAIQSSTGLLIGYERKRVSDLVNSMQDRRLAGHQLKGMRDTYDRVELIVEGNYLPGAGGVIEVPNGGNQWKPLLYGPKSIDYRQIDSYLYSQYEMGGVGVWRTRNLNETAYMIASRWSWWQKDYELHKSHDVIYSNNPTVQKRGAVHVHHGAPNPVTLWAAQIPGLDSKAWDVGKHFTSPYHMATATPEEWSSLWWEDRKGNRKRFGRSTAGAIVDWIQGRKI
jgi:hypothetical protein